MQKLPKGIQLSYFQVGTIVTLKASFLGEPIGTRAFVYESYKIGSEKIGYVIGVSVITENGVNLGGFSIDEQKDYLEYYTDTGQHYHFKNVIQLDIDFEKYIKPFFLLPKKELRESKTSHQV